MPIQCSGHSQCLQQREHREVGTRVWLCHIVRGPGQLLGKHAKDERDSSQVAGQHLVLMPTRVCSSPTSQGGSHSGRRGHLHRRHACASSVMRSTTYKGRIVTALREIVSSDLRIVPTPPQSENSAHLQAVLNVFHFREQKHTRGRLLHGENLWSDAKFDEMEKKEQAFTAIINGEH